MRKIVYVGLVTTEGSAEYGSSIRDDGHHEMSLFHANGVAVGVNVVLNMPNAKNKRYMVPFAQIGHLVWGDEVVEEKRDAKPSGGGSGPTPAK